MKTTPSLRYFLVCLFSTGLLAFTLTSTAVTSTNLPSMESLASVTVRDYCDFLNYSAVTDEHHLYDNAMASDPNAASIERIGEPGGYRYEVIAGRENLPITYLNEFAQEFYRNWLQHGELITNEENSNDCLKTNTKHFEVTSSETSLLTLVAAPTSNATPSSNSYWSDAVAAAGIIAFTAFGHELMVEEGRPATDSRPLAEQPSLTLNDFRAAAEAHPMAERFVIHEDGTIQPREAGLTAPRKIKSENMAITQTLKAALQQE
ncbi:MAG: hypothetical protein ACH346_04820, partial [Chthoniobacterales bacterium]